MQTARKIRVTEGKHVIPVPTFEIKKDFSGYLLTHFKYLNQKEEDKNHIFQKNL